MPRAPDAERSAALGLKAHHNALELLLFVELIAQTIGLGALDERADNTRFTPSALRI
ncbi:hypothetical protein PSYJA_27721 [Pseudomonas syringae pv. japonica str. M301072]|uniref:Uncharacterized protein n=1 Tax=Pseudomonas syringae pv. japonica str. M301072 TaxID=629262 RepID=F3FQQ6_PSESX|nr:hypothetical protein PSYJA_27721 [Pseudomonas syringae pv. japonica str. M301072]